MICQASRRISGAGGEYWRKTLFSWSRENGLER